MKSTLIDYLDSRLGPHIGRAPEIQFFCPFCPDRRGSESSQPRFRFNTVKKKGMCFRCGYAAKTLMALFKDLNGGKILLEEQSFLKEEQETAFQENVYGKVLVTLFGAEQQDRELIPVPLPGEYEPLWEDVSFLGRIGRNYLLDDRHIRKSHLKKFEIGYCATGDYEGRVIFPVTLNGRVVYFSNRYAGDYFLKTKNPKNRKGFYTRDDVLYGFDQCKGAKSVLLVEGPISLLRATDHYPTMAMLGKRLSEQQTVVVLEMVEEGLEELIVGVDADALPTPIYNRLLCAVPKVSFLPLRKGDPDENYDRLEKLLKCRRPLEITDEVRRILGQNGGKHNIFGVDGKMALDRGNMQYTIPT
jgi:hypothetical protein